MSKAIVVIVVSVFICLSSSIGSVADFFGIASAAIGALQAGTSIVQSVNAQTNHDVRMNMEIENYSRWHFRTVKAYSKSGYIKVVPVDLLAGRKERLYAHKVSGTAAGTWGVVRFESSSRELKEKYIYVMWSVPYNQNHHVNWLAVHCTSQNRKLLGAVTYDMYYSANYTQYRKPFYDNIDPVQCACGRYDVVATMGSSHAPEVLVKIVPRIFDDFAEALKVYVQERNAIHLRRRVPMFS